MDTTAKILNILASREGRGAAIVTSQFDPEDWYKSLHDAVVVEAIMTCSEGAFGSACVTKW
ncbi:hypothetical protein BLSMQ_0533 [Brevibacterium aurantiacum]|uniref:Uncharacterized protein n=1 Tax=Brevibacterium aurantiacum TaxID=273384 RepID=A0A1D7VZT1_BREAU|nr:hypothetical protein BLSMQ_0533 [Brevibacterium aurantiacum]